MTPSVALALFVAAPSDAAHPTWMVGTWAWQNPDETGVHCGSDHDTTYHPDGRYSFIDEIGTWRVEGDRLIETVADPGASGDPAMRGKSTALRFKRTRAGILQVAGPNPGKLIKCRGS